VSPPSVPVSVPTVPVASAAPSRPHRRSRTADAALLLAAFVATAGVAFATGRWSAADSPSVAPIRAAFELPAAAAPAAAAGLPAPAALSAVDVNDASATAGPVSAGAISAGTVSAGAASAGRDPVASDDPSVAVSRDPGVRGALAAGPPAAGGLQGPVGAMAGFGPGGLQGTISAIGDGTLALTSADGSVVTVATDASTTYVRETPIEATEVQLGDLVSVQVPFAGPRGQDGAAPDQSLVAEQVTLLPD
jgi:hypothetical protein